MSVMLLVPALWLRIPGPYISYLNQWSGFTIYDQQSKTLDPGQAEAFRILAHVAYRRSYPTFWMDF
ncbi:unnamed protein product, partial [marine sediment metagenome]